MSVHTAAQEARLGYSAPPKTSWAGRSLVCIKIKMKPLPNTCAKTLVSYKSIFHENIFIIESRHQARQIQEYHPAEVGVFGMKPAAPWAPWEMCYSEWEGVEWN